MMASDKLNAHDQLLEGNESCGSIDGNVSATEANNILFDEISVDSHSNRKTRANNKPGKVIKGSAIVSK